MKITLKPFIEAPFFHLFNGKHIRCKEQPRQCDTLRAIRMVNIESIVNIVVINLIMNVLFDLDGKKGHQLSRQTHDKIETKPYSTVSLSMFSFV